METRTLPGAYTKSPRTPKRCGGFAFAAHFRMGKPRAPGKRAPAIPGDALRPRSAPERPSLAARSPRWAVHRTPQRRSPPWKPGHCQAPIPKAPAPQKGAGALLFATTFHRTALRGRPVSRYTATMARHGQEDSLSKAQWALLRLLADGDEHSAGELTRAVPGTTADIDGLIAQFEPLGLCVVQQPGGGWKLTAPVDLLNVSAIRSHLQGGLEVPEIRVLGSTGSTNDLLRRCPLAPNGLVYLAEHQAAGRGRRGRGWVSPLASNLALSISWQYPRNFPQLAWVSLAMGVKIAEALEAMGFDGIGLKWPNDLVVGDAKLGGLLIELGGTASGPLNLVCGVGINVWMGKSDHSGIDQPWTSLDRLGVPAGVDRNVLAATLIGACIDVLSRMPTEDVEMWRKGWAARDSLKGRAVNVTASGGPNQNGIGGGVSRAGEFILVQGDLCRKYTSAEVSVRPAP